MDKIFMLPAFTKIVKFRDVTIDNTIFRLHYRITAIFLVVASLMISATQFFGDPIKCILPKQIPAPVVESYCWVESTFTLPKALSKKVGEHVPYPGVDKFVEGDEIIKHSYYQWVCVMLFLQGLLFFVPHLLWKNWEGHKLQGILQHLFKPVLSKDEKEKEFEDLSSYFIDRGRTQGDYFFKFFLSEILNFVNVVGQIFLMDKFLGGEFTTYGSDVFKFMMEDQDDRVDPMIRVFPRMTKCSFHHYGPSGDVQKLDTYCVLPLNILNEKLYAILWFWFVILAILTGLGLVYRLVMILSPTARFMAIRSVNFMSKRDRLGTVLHFLDYGDWFLLYMVGANIDSLHFMELIDVMAEKIDRMPGYGSEESVTTETKT